MVRSISLLAVVFSLTSWTLIDDRSQAQEQTPNISVSRTSAATELAQAEPKPKTRKAPAGRVPNGWGQLGLSPEQKKNIYEIQAKYKQELEDLQKQIENLKIKELEEMEGVLTADQLSKLKAQTKTTKEKSDAGKSEAKSEQSADSK